MYDKVDSGIKQILNKKTPDAFEVCIILLNDLVYRK